MGEALVKVFLARAGHKFDRTTLCLTQTVAFATAIRTSCFWAVPFRVDNCIVAFSEYPLVKVSGPEQRAVVYHFRYCFAEHGVARNVCESLHYVLAGREVYTLEQSLGSNVTPPRTCQSSLFERRLGEILENRSEQLVWEFLDTTRHVDGDEDSPREPGNVSVWPVLKAQEALPLTIKKPASISR